MPKGMRCRRAWNWISLDQKSPRASCVTKNPLAVEVTRRIILSIFQSSIHLLTSVTTRLIPFSNQVSLSASSYLATFCRRASSFFTSRATRCLAMYTEATLACNVRAVSATDNSWRT